MQYGWGFQTWEYSPVYALRSYLFLMPHVGVTAMAAKLFGRKVAAFFAARVVQGLLSAWLEYRFAEAVATRCTATGTLTLWMLAGTAGMFHASSAFLPSRYASDYVSLPYRMSIVCATQLHYARCSGYLAFMDQWQFWSRNSWRCLHDRTRLAIFSAALHTAWNYCTVITNLWLSESPFMGMYFYGCIGRRFSSI